MKGNLIWKYSTYFLIFCLIIFSLIKHNFDFNLYIFSLSMEPDSLTQRILYLESLLHKNNISFSPSSPSVSPPPSSSAPPSSILPPLSSTPPPSPSSSFPPSSIPPPLTPSLLLRYSRQMLLPEISLSGQLLLSTKKVLIVGAGGLGAPLLLYLVGAGVSIGISDFDKVEVSNLHRQVIYGGKEGGGKREEGRKRAEELNGEVEVREEERIGKENAEEVVGRYDLVVDASDNAETRYLLNDVCFISKQSLI